MTKAAGKFDAGVLITATEGAAVLGVSISWVSRLIRDGYIPEAKSRRYRLADVVQGYIRFLKDEERRTSKVQAESGLKAARQREVELRIAVREGQLVELDDIKSVFIEVEATLRAELSGLPSAVTRDVKLREEIEKYLNGAFARSSDKFQEACGVLQTGGDPMGADREDDA